jgi:Mannosyltransferase (PIG-V)
VETIPERLDPRSAPAELPSNGAGVSEAATATDEATAVDAPVVHPVRARPRRRVAVAVRRDVLWVLTIYLGTRGLLLLTAYVQSAFGHHDFLHELANWDGLWYREVANHGYPSHTSHAQTTLGFFPLYPVTIWILEPVFSILSGQGSIWSATVAGIVISTIGGAVASYFVYRLATTWWGKEVARRATVLFIVFPGSVVFSMVYSEALLLPLAAACLLALERRRWLLAGILAGLATAVQPTGLVLIPVCAISALLELRRRGWGRSDLRRVLMAPALSLAGVGAFALFLWLWTGSPFANYEAQHYGWSEKTDALALVHLTTKLAGQISFTHLNEPSINLNLVVGLIGAILLLVMLVMMFFQRRQISVEAILWTLGIGYLAITSEYVPPNPRMLLTAFPAIMVAARYIRGGWFTLLVWSNCVLLVVLSVLTFYGTTLRP